MISTIYVVVNINKY
jgi:hypothetical protein